MSSTMSRRAYRYAFLPGLTLAAFLAGLGGTALAGAISTGVAETTGPQASIEIVDFMQFTPVDMTVASGTTVTWTNLDGSNHNVMVDGQQSGRMNMNATWSHTFNEAGTFEYTCFMHPRMKGTITVE